MSVPVILIAILVFIGAFLGVAFFVMGQIYQARETREMLAKGYSWEFVICCSADEGSYQWAKNP